MAKLEVRNVESKEELDAEVGGGGGVFVHFWAAWCEPSKHMDSVFAQLAVDNPHAAFLRVEAEEQPEISEALGVSNVPFFIFFKNGAVVDKLEGANPPELARKVAKFAGPAPIAATTVPASEGFKASTEFILSNGKHALTNGNHEGGNSEKQEQAPPGLSDTLKAELQALTTSKPVFLFMKGNPDAPRCGFSRKVVDALKDEGVDFGSFDILSDDSVRQGLKVFSNWPTFPQLFVKGELVGGSDIVLEMHTSGELKTLFTDSGLMAKASPVTASGLTDTVEESPSDTEPQESKSQTLLKIKSLLQSKPIMLFMKGTPEEPRCGFSRKVVNALKDLGVDFGSFDILSDGEVRQELKAFSNWPTYPQLYLNGELLGGCDIVLEMHLSGELKETFSNSGLLPKPSLEERLKQLIRSSETMLFMKGTPEEPRCGFSRKVVAALKEEGVEFGSFDILSDEDVRQGLKTFSNWPTFPQLYHKGELLGGCDIVLEMKGSGELKAALLA